MSPDSRGHLVPLSQQQRTMMQQVFDYLSKHVPEDDSAEADIIRKEWEQ